MLHLFLSRTETDKDTAVIIFFIDAVLLSVACFAVGYFCSTLTCLMYSATLYGFSIPAPFYFKHRQKLRRSLMPPVGSPNKAYLDYMIAFDRAAPWKRYGDTFFDLFCPKTFVFFAILIAIGRLVAHIVR